MSGESNQIKWVGVRPTNPEEDFSVKQSDHTKVAGLKSFRDSAGNGRRMLVDADRHGQVDVLTMPALAVELAPPGGTQLRMSGTATNGSTMLYQVPSGKKLHLSAIALSCRGSGTGHVALYIAYATGVEFCRLLDLNQIANEGMSETNQFLPQVRLWAGTQLVVYSSAANVLATAFLGGYAPDV